MSHFLLELFQNKFKDEPVVLITAEHLRTDKEYDAALIWTEDITKDSFKVCPREFQNFDGKQENISVVCSLSPRIAKLSDGRKHEDISVSAVAGLKLLGGPTTSAKVTKF